jgi:hypothetical protein
MVRLFIRTSLFSKQAKAFFALACLVSAFLFQNPFYTHSQTHPKKEESQDLPKPSITFRAKKEVSEETLDLLEKIAQPKIISTLPNEPLQKAAQRFYGDLGIRMIPRIKKANPNFPENGSAAPMLLKMPPAPNIQYSNIQYKNAGSVNHSILANKAIIGAIMGGIPNIIASPTPNPNLSVKSLSASKHTGFILKPEYANNPNLAGNLLKATPDLNEVSSGSLVMVTPVGMVSNNGVCQTSEPTNKKWYEKALGLEDINLFRLKDIPVTIGFFDTGIGACEVDEEKRLDIRFEYWQNGAELEFHNKLDGDNDKYVDDTNGVNVTVVGDLEANPYNNQNPNNVISDEELCPTFIDANHGTHVAGILSGFIFNDELKAKTKGKISLLPIKITDDQRQLTNDYVTKAWQFLDFQKEVKTKNKSSFPQVINLSFVDIEPDIEQYKNKINKFNETLFVASAGNVSTKLFGGKQVSLDKRRLFPATAKFPNLMTVSALKENFELADFSFYGVETVDLAAPGENIYSTVKDFENPNSPQAMGFASGTSQAAPFVSYTAALLYMMGYKDPGKIRRRIINSTDFYPRLRNSVWSSGSLNISKAINIYDDLITIKKEGEPTIIKKGLISSNLNITATIPSESGGEPITLIFPIEQIRKIIPVYEADANGKIWSAIIVSTHNDLLDDSPRQLRLIKCELDLGANLQFVEDIGKKLDDKNTSISWKEISDVTLCDLPDRSFTRKDRKDQIRRDAPDVAAGMDNLKAGFKDLQDFAEISAQYIR